MEIKNKKTKIDTVFSNKSITENEATAITEIAETELANDVKAMGFESLQEMTKSVGEAADNGSRITNSHGNSVDAKAVVKELGDTLIKLVLKQTLLKGDYSNGLSTLLGRIKTDRLNEGNAHQFVYNIATGLVSSANFKSKKFNPTEQSGNVVETEVLELYKDAQGDTLNDYAYMIDKYVSFPVDTYIPYFKSGNLNKFIANITYQATSTIQMFESNKLGKLITETIKWKTVAATGNNTFECFVKDICPNIRNLRLASKKFKTDDTSNFYEVSDWNDIVLVGSNKTISALLDGVNSQLPGFKFSNEGSIIDKINIINLGVKYNVPEGTDENPSIGTASAITDTGTEWVDDNTLYVFDINTFIKLIQVDTTATQDYATNLTSTIHIHLWGIIHYLNKKGKGFKYTNNNLTKLPGETNV